jgi:serine-type D-Ala-D-Ala carboxypeptidase (penicillin-binding protein 5/6)
MNIKKTTFFVSLLTLILFAGSVGVLLATPKVVNLVDSTLVLAQNETFRTPSYLQPSGKVAGIQRKPQVKILNNNIIPPKIYSRAAIAIDVDTNKVLFEKDSTVRVPPASTTKIMTALVSKDIFRPADVLTVTKQAMVGGSTMGLTLGETMSYRALLYGMMLNSGNDAAFTIASNYSEGGIPAFMEKMNAKVAELGLMDTHFQNPSGFDAPDHYSSAYDLAQIAREAVKDPTIAKVIGTKDTEVMSWDKMHRHDLANLNELLGEDGVIGVKTGTTDLAGESFVGLVERDGHQVITVVLNSPDRFGETKALIDWIYSNYDWKLE